MQFEKLTNDDLKEIRHLQPEGWSDIVPEFRSYINHDFCYPVKIKLDDKIVGIGTSIMFGKTGWLAHIIVDKEYRNKGIGYQIVVSLLEDVRNQGIKTCLLIATDLGMPVYIKTGFKIVTEYLYLKREKSWIEFPVSKNVVPYQNKYYQMIIGLDIKISGEYRERLIKEYLDNSIIYIENKEVKGYYLPGLGEGPICADTDSAGLELMKIKYSNVDKAVLPYDNATGIEFLKQNGFIETDTKGTRMILGNHINWKPEKIFSRIGGNYG
ncbi:MAG: GNAT family N-acetyltransferase [Bacteroidales bacterium]|nr:MAG: GNAT family N-acetyltransferase [Bacteroidales bacterium]